MWIVLKLFLCCFVLQCNMPGTFAKVGDTCGACADNIEVCKDGKCVCADNHINTGDGTCVSSVCTPGQSACSTIDNAYCSTDTCVCNVLSGVSEADDAKKGSCVLKSCVDDTSCGDANLGMKCDTAAQSNDVCACNQDLTPTDTSCITSGLDAACTGNPQCSGVDNAVCTSGFCKCGSGFADIDDVCKAHAGSSCLETGDCVTNAACDSTSKCACNENYVAVQGLCKVQAGSSCSDTADCVTNAACDSTSNLCTCNENYVDVEGLCKDTVGDCITDPADTCEDPGAVCETDAQKCYCPNGVEETGACKIDRSGGSTRRPFVGGALMFAVVTALRLLN